MYEVCIRFFVKPASSAQIAKKMRTQLVELACRTWSSSIYHISTAQRNQPCTKERSTYVPIRVRQRKQADRVGESQHVVEHLQLAVFSKPTNKSKSVTRKNIQPQASGEAGRIWVYFWRRYNLNTIVHSSFSVVFRTYPYICMIWCMHAAFELFWSMELLAFASRLFTVCT